IRTAFWNSTVGSRDPTEVNEGNKGFWSAANPTLRFLRFLLLYCFAFCPSSLISRGHDGACPSTQKMVYVDVWKIQTTMKSTRFHCCFRFGFLKLEIRIGGH